MKTNKFFAGLLLIMGLLLFLPASPTKAYELITSGDGLWEYEVLAPNTIELQGIVMTNYEAAYGPITEITFPSVVDGYQVASISLFQNSLSSKVTNVTVPEGITTLKAFFLGHSYNEASLVSIQLPASLTAIESNTFSKCSSLASVNFAPNSQLSTIGVLAFSKTTSLNAFDFKQFTKLTHLGNSAFSGSFLQTVQLPDNLTIDYNVFGECPALTSVSVGQNTVLESSVFANDPSLKTAVFGDGCKLGINMFKKSNNLSVLNLGKVKALDQNLFDSTKIKKLSIPKSCTSMPSIYGGFNLCPKDVVLYIDKSSVAETYAKKTGYTYRYLGEEAKDITVGKVSSLKIQKKSASTIKINWKKVKDSNGYEIYMKTNSGTYKKISTIKKSSTVTFTQKKLKKNNTYTFKVRAYKNVDGKKIYGSYSTEKKLKLK